MRSVRKILYVLLFTILILVIFTACEEDIQIKSTARPTVTPKPTPTIEPTVTYIEDKIETPEPTVFPDDADQFYGIFAYGDGIYQLKDLKITKLVEGRSMYMVLSPDKNKIASLEKETAYSDEALNVYDLQGNRLCSFNINFRHNIISWIDYENVLVEGSTGPNIQSYLICNIRTNSVKEVLGKGLSIIPRSGQYAYFESGPMEYNFWLNVNDEVVYSTEISHMIIKDFAFDSTGDEGVLIEVDADNNVMILRVFDYYKPNFRLNMKSICVMDISNYSKTDVFYDEKDEIYIDFGSAVYYFDKDLHEVIKMDEYVKKKPEVPETIKERNRFLEVILSKEFGDGDKKGYFTAWIS